jgi:hypothetical protein
MFSYITSLLNFQGQPNATTNEPLTPSNISCQGYGWTVPSKDIRLAVANSNSSEVHIFGFPPQEDFPKAMKYPPPTFGTDGPYIHYVLGDSPASVDYIMGDDWRSRLQSNLWDSSRGDVIFRPSVALNNSSDRQISSKDDPVALEEERAHSLRMRRCGAVAVFPQEDISTRNIFWAGRRAVASGCCGHRGRIRRLSDQRATPKTLKGVWRMRTRSRRERLSTSLLPRKRTGRRVWKMCVGCWKKAEHGSTQMSKIARRRWS